MMAQEVPEPKFVSLICSISFLQCCWKSGQQLPCSSHSASPRGKWLKQSLSLTTDVVLQLIIIVQWFFTSLECCKIAAIFSYQGRRFRAPQILWSQNPSNIKKLRIIYIILSKPQLLPCVTGKHRICDMFHSHRLYMSRVWRRLPHNRGSTSRRQCTPRYLVLDRGICEFSTGPETLSTTFPHSETCGKGLQALYITVSYRRCF